MLSPFIEGSPDQMLEHVHAYGLEGMVGKLLDSRYEAGQRSRAWIKFKILNEQEFVIGGYTQAKGSHGPFGAPVVGFYEGGKLVYASKVGTGFTPRQMKTLMAKFKPLVQAECPFANLPESKRSRWGQTITAAEMKTITWLKPGLVCQVAFTEWTDGAHLRHRAFRGLRDDKAPTEVIREAGA